MFNMFIFIFVSGDVNLFFTCLMSADILRHTPGVMNTFFIIYIGAFCISLSCNHHVGLHLYKKQTFKISKLCMMAFNMTFG